MKHRYRNPAFDLCFISGYVIRSPFFSIAIARMGRLLLAETGDRCTSLGRLANRFLHVQRLQVLVAARLERFIVNQAVHKVLLRGEHTVSSEK